MSAAYKSAMIQTFCIPLAEARTRTEPAPGFSRTHVPSRSRAGSNGPGISRTSSACARASRRSARPGAQSRSAKSAQPRTTAALSATWASLSAPGERCSATARHREGKAPERNASRLQPPSWRQRMPELRFPARLPPSSARRHRGPAPLIGLGSDGIAARCAAAAAYRSNARTCEAAPTEAWASNHRTSGRSVCAVPSSWSSTNWGARVRN